MKATNAQISTSASPISPPVLKLFGPTAEHGAALPEYMVDALQRSVLMLDIRRRRGNEEIEITADPVATVLGFDHEVLMDGRSLARPINSTLSRISCWPCWVCRMGSRPRSTRRASAARAARAHPDEFKPL